MLYDIMLSYSSWVSWVYDYSLSGGFLVPGITDIDLYVKLLLVYGTTANDPLTNFLGFISCLSV